MTLNSGSSKIRCDNERIFEELKETLQAQGCRIHRQIIDDADALSVTLPSGVHAFWLGYLENQWILCMVGPRYFVLDSAIDHRSFILSVFELIMEYGLKVSVNDTFCRSWKLKRFPIQEWYKARSVRWRSRCANMGWMELSRNDVNHLWDKALTLFDISESGWRLPSPSRTWDVTRFGSLPTDGFEITSLVEDLESKLAVAMEDVCKHDHYWVALDFNHPSFRVHTQVMKPEYHPWPVPPFPNYDEAYFLKADFSCGILTKLHSAIRVFGKQLVETISNNPPEIFGDVVDEIDENRIDN